MTISFSFLVVILVVLIFNDITASERGSNDVGVTPTLIYVPSSEGRSNEPIETVNKSISQPGVIVPTATDQVPVKNGSDSMIGFGQACDCKCNCCLQMTLSCEHFCICVEDRVPRHEKCLGDLKFNPDIENCDLETNFECPVRPTAPPVFQCPPNQGLFQYPGNCSLFIQCNANKPYVHYCPANLHFCETCDPKGCEYRDYANCTAEDGLTHQKRTMYRSRRSVVEENILTHSVLKCPTKYGFYPVPGNPRNFYKCLNGQPTKEMQCPMGLVYNPSISACSKISIK